MEVKNVFLKAVDHIAIISSNYEKSKEFYVNTLGFKIINETYRSDRASYKLDLALGDNYLIELFSFPNPPERLSHPEARGLRHLAFKVEDIDKSVSYLKDKGIEVEKIRFDKFRNKRFTFFKDPDDLPIEICEE